MDKQSLFISYCWRDGNVYADELETQLKDKFNVKRDKSQLITNDDIFDFMSENIRVKFCLPIRQDKAKTSRFAIFILIYCRHCAIL